MKKLAIMTLCAFVSACATAPAITPNDLTDKNLKSSIKYFASTMEEKCASEVAEEKSTKRKFCACVEKKIVTNMSEKMSLAQVKQTLTGAAAGKQPVPNSRTVFSGVKESCVQR